MRKLSLREAWQHSKDHLAETGLQGSNLLVPTPLTLLLAGIMRVDRLCSSQSSPDPLCTPRGLPAGSHLLLPGLLIPSGPLLTPWAFLRPGYILLAPLPSLRSGPAWHSPAADPMGGGGGTGEGFAEAGMGLPVCNREGRP